MSFLKLGYKKTGFCIAHIFSLPSLLTLQKANCHVQLPCGEVHVTRN